MVEMVLRRIARLVPVAAALVAMIPAVARSQGKSTLSVGVADAETGAPIAGAEIVLPELKILTRSDASGQARVPGIPLGTHRVRVRLLGYTASDVQLKFEGDTTGAVFRLGKSPAALSGVDVTASPVPAQLKDFETRRKQGIGRFLTESDLVPVADRDFMLVASTKFPGVTIQTDDGKHPHLAGTRSGCGGAGGAQAANRGVDRIGAQAGAKPKLGMRDGYEDGDLHGSCESSRACLMQVWLDNINLGESDPGLIRTWDLSGVEYYTGNSVPARYRTSGSACGVVVLWSKWSQ
jgi:hypothetical protein